MILRTVPGRIRPGGIADLATGRVAGSVARAEPPPGLLRAHVAVDRGGRELLTVSVWDSVESAVGADSSTGDDELDRMLAEVGDLEEPTYFDIGGTWVQRSQDPPVALRLAIGRFTKPGSDIEMQDLLRRRLPTIGAAMSEACVGRRIVGNSVEVLFYSAWLEEPADRPLDISFWPDISLRYDHFAVRVFVPVAVAAEALPG